MKKTIIYIAIALVAAILVWKSGILAKLKASAAASLPAGIINDPENVGSQNTDTFSYYINRTSMTDSEKSKCLDWCKVIEKACKKNSNGWSISDTQDKADDLGITYNAQIVRSALWQMHETSKLFGVDYFHQMSKEATGVA